MIRSVGVLILGAALPGMARADSGWSATVGVVSDYVSRGFDQSWGHPAVQAGVEYRHAAGWFAGTWVSTISPRFIEGGSWEWDGYGGYGGQLKAIRYQAGLYYYHYPGARMSATHTRYDYGETMFKIGTGGLDLSYAVTVTPDYFGDNSATLGQGQGLHSRGSGYLSLDGSFPLSSSYTLGLHYGYQSVRHFSHYNWSDAKVSVQTQLYGLDVALAYTRAWSSHGVYRHYTTGVPDNAGHMHVSNPTAGRLVLSISRTF